MVRCPECGATHSGAWIHRLGYLKPVSRLVALLTVGAPGLAMTIALLLLILLPGTSILCMVAKAALVVAPLAGIVAMLWLWIDYLASHRRSDLWYTRGGVCCVVGVVLMVLSPIAAVVLAILVSLAS